MKTEIISSLNDKTSGVNRALELIGVGNIIAIPTETVYGLSVLIDNPKAVNNLFELKQRPADKPFAILVNSIHWLEQLTIKIPDIFYRLAARFMPGPVTYILKKNPSVNYSVTSGSDTIALRIPDDDFVLELIATLNTPIIATSANLSGQEPATSANQVSDYFDGKIPLIIDGGVCRYSKGSTVVDLTTDQPVILREGAITRAEMNRFF